MVSVEDQIRMDYALSGPLGDLRSHLDGLGIVGELDHLLKHWNNAVSTSDFTGVARRYRSLMRTILKTMAGHSAIDAVNHARDAKDSHLVLLLPAAVAGLYHQNSLGSDKPGLDETLAELSGILEALEVYGNPRAYLRERQSSPWLEEHYNADELTGKDPLLLYEFVFDIEQFISYLIDARQHFFGPEE